MTTSAVTPRVKYNGSGSAGPFSIPFVWTDIVVVKTSSAGVETTLSETTNYTTTGVGTDTGSLTLTVALAVGETLTIERTTPTTQTLDLTRSYIDYDLIEAAFDKLTRQAQDILYQVGRTLRLYKDDTAGSGAYNAGNQQIKNVADGTANQDAATVKQLNNVVGSSSEAIAAAAAAAASAAAAAQSAQDIQSVVAGSVVTFEGRVGAVVSAAGDYTASEIVNVPNGNLSSINVQAALDELQTDINALQSGDPLLNAIAALTTSADKLIYTTGTDTVALSTLTSFARSLLDDTSASDARATLGLVIGTNVQPYAAELSTVAGEVTAYSHTLIAANSASSARSVLGLGSAATSDTSAFQSSDATLSSLASYNTNGILTQSAADTFVGRTITAGTGITVTNGNGVSGNPTLAVDIDGLTTRTAFESGDKLMIYEAGVGIRKIDYDDLPNGGGGGGLANAYKDITDGTTTASASGADTFKLRASTGVTVTVGSNDVTHGDNALIGLNTPLTALAGTTAAADKVPYFSSGSAATTATLTSYGRDLISAADASAAQTTLALVPGVNVQAYDAQLADVAGLTPSNNTFIVGNGTNFTTQSGATARTSLGVGSVADGGTGVSTLTANNVILGNGTSAVQFVAPGTSGNVLTSDGTTWTSSTPSGVPSGSITAYGGTTEPSGWLFCYGQAISRSTYSALFSAIGTTYGAGDGSTTFALPDLRGRVAAGKDNMGGSAANRITSGGSGITGTTLGAAGGAETHTLTTAQLASHTHTTTSSASSPVAGNIGTVNSVSGSTNTGATGGGNAHNNTQPTIMLNYIIKT